MKKWLAIEALLLTLLPAVLLMYAAPLVVFGLVQVFQPLEGDARTVVERLFGIAPYVGGGFAIGALWYLAVGLQKNISLRGGMTIGFGVLGGILASWEVIRTTNLESSLLICAPPWVFAAHLGYLALTRRFE